MVMEEKANGWVLVFEFPAELPCLLRDPSGSWMFGTSRNMNTARSQLDEEQDIHRFEPQGFDREEIAG